jgi:hypothetical protein
MGGPIHWTDDPVVWKGEFEGHLHGSGVSIVFARLEPGSRGRISTSTRIWNRKPMALIEALDSESGKVTAGGPDRSG